jgi:hypothetical protein
VYSKVFLTLTEVFPCCFLSCKANARVKLAKMGHGPHSSTLVVICVVRLIFVLFGCYLCCSVDICVVRLLFVLFGCYLYCSVVICVIQLLFALFNVLFVCKCVLPPGDNPTAVNKCHIVSYQIILNFVTSLRNC